MRAKRASEGEGPAGEPWVLPRFYPAIAEKRGSSRTASKSLSSLPPRRRAPAKLVCALQVRDPRLPVAVEHLEAGGVVVRLPFVRPALDRSVDELTRPVDLALVRVGEGGEDVLPGGGLEDLARLGSDREHRGVVLRGDRAALRSRPREDDRPRGRVDLVVAERERRASAEDDVHLLVAVLLGVLLDDALTRPGRVGVRPERADPEAPSHRPPDELALVDRQLLQLVHVRDLVSFTHSASLKARGRPGRSARPRRPALPGSRCRTNARTRPAIPRRSPAREPLAQLGREPVVDLDPLIPRRTAEQGVVEAVQAPELLDRERVVVDTEVDDRIVRPP